MVKALFACWDPSRLGHITVEVLTENLIGFGLSVSQDQVDKLLAALNLHPDEPKKRVEDITLNNFVKILRRIKIFSIRFVVIHLLFYWKLYIH